ncbi:MAG: flagellar basal body-associated FliL family protein [Alphaproteobacteria bacterium]|nr:flagellar basal body-associated FliL family protein [Alphaproteobacteria bacterium]
MAEDIEQGDTEAEAVDGEAEGEGEAGSRSGKKMGIIIILAVLLIGGGAGAAWYFGLLDSFLGGAEETGEAADTEESDTEVTLDEEGNPIIAHATYFAMPEFLINLSSNTSQTSFIKMRISLKLPSEKDQEVVVQRLPELQNEFNTYLRDLRASDLAGSAGMYRLQEELLARANRILSPAAQVDKILFTEILIQ